MKSERLAFLENLLKLYNDGIITQEEMIQRKEEWASQETLKFYERVDGIYKAFLIAEIENRYIEMKRQYAKLRDMQIKETITDSELLEYIDEIEKELENKLNFSRGKLVEIEKEKRSRLRLFFIIVIEILMAIFVWNIIRG